MGLACVRDMKGRRLATLSEQWPQMEGDVIGFEQHEHLYSVCPIPMGLSWQGVIHFSLCVQQSATLCKNRQTLWFHQSSVLSTCFPKSEFNHPKCVQERHWFLTRQKVEDQKAQWIKPILGWMSWISRATKSFVKTISCFMNLAKFLLQYSIVFST